MGKKLLKQIDESNTQSVFRKWYIYWFITLVVYALVYLYYAKSKAAASGLPDWGYGSWQDFEAFMHIMYVYIPTYAVLSGIFGRLFFRRFWTLAFAYWFLSALLIIPIFAQALPVKDNEMVNGIGSACIYLAMMTIVFLMTRLILNIRKRRA